MMRVAVCAWPLGLLAAGCPATAELRLLRDPTQDAAPDAPPDDTFDLDADLDADAGSARDMDAGDTARDGGTGESTDAAAGPMLRYDFGGRGTQVRDLVGRRHARIMGGAALDGSGRLQLDGEDDYVDLPNGLLDGLDAVTIVVWYTWQGGPCWQRVFDFGSNDRGEGAVGYARSSLFYTVLSCPGPQSLVMAEVGGMQHELMGGETRPEQAANVAVVIDGPQRRARLYENGRLVAEGEPAFRLADIDDVNNWLGRSQWVQDVNARIRYDELRMYDRALSDSEIVRLLRGEPRERR